MTDSAMFNISINHQRNCEPLKTTLAATEEELVFLAEKLTEFAIPLKVLLLALDIASYDKAAGFDYAEQYLDKIKNPKRIVLKSFEKSWMKWNIRRIMKPIY